MDGSVDEMACTTRRQLVKSFENLIWVHADKSWSVKIVYFLDTLFITVLIPVSNNGQYEKICRNISMHALRLAEGRNDVCGFSQDILDEIKADKKRNH